MEFIRTLCTPLEMKENGDMLMGDLPGHISAWHPHRSERMCVWDSFMQDMFNRKESYCSTPTTHCPITILGEIRQSPMVTQTMLIGIISCSLQAALSPEVVSTVTHGQKMLTYSQNISIKTA